MSQFILTLTCLLTLSLAQAQTHDTMSESKTESGVTQTAEDELAVRGFGDSPEDIRRFQRAYGLEETGELDQETVDALGIEREPAEIETDDSIERIEDYPSEDEPIEEEIEEGVDL